MILREVATLLTTAPTSIVYHISGLIIFTFLLTFLSVLPSDRTPRWKLAAGSLVAFQFTLAGLALMGEAGAVDQSHIFPVIDRFILLSSVVLLLWACMSSGAKHPLDGAAIAIAVLLLIGLALNIVLRPASTADFNATIPDAIWAVAGLVISLAAAVLIAIRRPVGWGLEEAGFIIFLSGYLLHITLGPSDGSLQGFVRWGAMFAYPLFSIAAIRQMVPAFSTQPEPRVELAPRQPAPTNHVDLGGLAELAGIASIRDIAGLSAQAVQGISRAMKIEYCLLLSLPDSRGEFALATGYDLIQEKHVSGIALNQKQCPLLSESLVQSQEISLPMDGQSPDMVVLKRLLDLKGSGPVHLIPLKGNSNLLGGLLVLSPYAREVFSNDELTTLRKIAAHLSDRIETIQSSTLMADIASEVEEEPPEPKTNLQRRILELEQENLSLHDQLGKTTLEGMQDRVRQMKSLTERYETAQETINSLEIQLDSISTRVEPAPGAPHENEYQIILTELADARSRIDEFERAQANPAVGPDPEALTSLADGLRKPLTSIRGYINVLLSESVGELSSMQRKFMERILDRLERMRFMLKDLIQVTELGTGSLSLEPGLLDPLPCLEKALRQVDAPRKTKNLLLHKDFPESLPDILADEDAFIQILIHFMENAIQVSPENEVITLRATTSETNQLLISISDRGGGIPQASIPLLLEQGIRPNGDPIQGISSEGLGFSIARALMKAMKAEVQIHSEAGVGTTFRLAFPIINSGSTA